MKIERVVRHYTAIYFRTTSDGVSHQWSLNWRPKKSKFAGPSWGCGKNNLGDPIGKPGWTPSLDDLVPHITDEDRAALLAISMRAARDGKT